MDKNILPSTTTIHTPIFFLHQPVAPSKASLPIVAPNLIPIPTLSEGSDLEKVRELKEGVRGLLKEKGGRRRRRRRGEGGGGGEGYFWKKKKGSVLLKKLLFWNFKGVPLEGLCPYIFGVCLYNFSMNSDLRPSKDYGFAVSSLVKGRGRKRQMRQM